MFFGYAMFSTLPEPGFFVPAFGVPFLEWEKRRHKKGGVAKLGELQGGGE